MHSVVGSGSLDGFELGTLYVDAKGSNLKTLSVNSAGSVWNFLPHAGPSEEAE
jgi:hypothetical protein